MEKIEMVIPDDNYNFKPEEAVGIYQITGATAAFIRDRIHELGISNEQHIAAFRTVLVELIRADEYAQKMRKEH